MGPASQSPRGVERCNLLMAGLSCYHYISSKCITIEPRALDVSEGWVALGQVPGKQNRKQRKIELLEYVSHVISNHAISGRR